MGEIECLKEVLLFAVVLRLEVFLRSFWTATSTEMNARLEEEAEESGVALSLQLNERPHWHEDDLLPAVGAIGLFISIRIDRYLPLEEKEKIVLTLRL